MESSKHSTIRLCLTPHFDADGVSALSVSLKVDTPVVQEGEPLFLFYTFTDNVPGHPYREEDIRACDDDGPLPLHFRDLPSLNRNTQQHWCVGRQSRGPVSLSFDAYARDVSEKTPLGARIDLRRDQGGLQGVGRWFLPLLISDETFVNVVEWNVPAGAPRSTRCIWSLGEGPEPITTVGLADTVWRTVYMVGPVQSYPESMPKTGPGLAACYWFGKLLPNIDRAKGYNVDLYPKMAAHFGVTGESYRVFIRRSRVGFGGTGFIGSYVMEYDESTADQTDDSLLLLFTHEMVHSFSDLSHEEDGYDNDWFREGLAELYSTYLPYRFGIRGEDFLVDSINGHLRGYFCNPRINMDIRDATSEVFSDWYAEFIAYKRGCAYLLFIDCAMRKQDNQWDMSENGRIDDIIIELSRRWREGETVRARLWLNRLLEQFKPQDLAVEDHFWSMIKGNQVISFQGLSFDQQSKVFAPVELPVLEFGFDKCSRRTRVVSGVLSGSNAEAAGLRNGMPLLRTTRPSDCIENAEKSFQVDVMEKSQRRTIEFLPQKSQQASTWLVPVGRSESHA